MSRNRPCGYGVVSTLVWMAAVFLWGCAPVAPVEHQDERGPSPMSAAARLLKPNPVNPRYFADPDGQAVYLTGSHTWNNLQDNALPGTKPAFDWGGYLDFLQAHHHNFVRLWSGQTILHGTDAEFDGAFPLPWLRTGPGVAIDGKPRVDLTKFNSAYFRRLRERVRTAGERGVYVDVMLFEGWCVTVGNAPGVKGHAFAEGNNVNGVDILASTREGVYADWVTLDNPEVVRLQERYVKKVVEAVNEFDNVLYEIANEPTGLSHAWQEHFVAFIQACEAKLPTQHPVGTPGGMKTYNRKMFAGSGDWVAPDLQAPDDDERFRYKDGTMTWGEPDYDNGDKVVILDTDHVWGIGGNAPWAWMSFCRGYNVIYMDPAGDFPSTTFEGTPEWPAEPNCALRREMGAIRLFADRVDLNRTLPSNELCSTGYCLAEPGRAYIAFQPGAGAFDLTTLPGRYVGQWRILGTGETTPASPIDLDEGVQSFVAPAEGAAVLFLQRLEE